MFHEFRRAFHHLRGRPNGLKDCPLSVSCSARVTLRTSLVMAILLGTDVGSRMQCNFQTKYLTKLLSWLRHPGTNLVFHEDDSPAAINKRSRGSSSALTSKYHSFYFANYRSCSLNNVRKEKGLC